jgi:hypothetical protein
MGAMKPGSTLPPQGGKGGVQQPIRPQVPMAGGKAPGAVQPGQPPYMPIGYPPVQPQVPAQGGKGPITLPRGVGDVFPTPQVQQPGQVPPQGGKGRDFGPNVFPGPQQPGQVPAQGGFPQQTGQVPDYMRPFISNLPQQPAPVQSAPVQSAVPGLQDAIRGAFLNAAPGSPTGYPTQPAPVQPQVQQRLSDMPQIQAAYGQPQVMPRPVPQVMPRQPTPKPAPMQPQGLAQMQQFLKQQQMLRGRR